VLRASAVCARFGSAAYPTPLLFLLFPLPPCSPLFPYTTLFRSVPLVVITLGVVVASQIAEVSAQLGSLMLTVPVYGLFAVINCRSEEHTSELQSRFDLVCRLLLEKKNRIHSLTMVRRAHAAERR